MRTHGTLTRWNDDRGFGFIAPALGSDEVFVHVSAFPRDGVRPRVGELISFDLETHEGKRRAVRVMRPGSQLPAHASRRASTVRPRNGLPAAVLALLVVGGVAAFGYIKLSPHLGAGPVAPVAAIAPIQAAPVEHVPAFTCDGRTRCPQMTSCAEARFFLKQCPGTKMDGDGDGEPCEQQWCH
ncbi:MAG: cold shock domain-containing protein [Rhodanobacter sp.]